MEALIKSCHLFFVCSGMPNVLQNNKLSISPGKVVLFSLFVHVVTDPWKLQCYSVVLVGYGPVGYGLVICILLNIH